jgi:phage recombination protein Bet
MKEIKYMAGGEEVTLSLDIIRKFLLPADCKVQPSDQELMLFLQLCRFQKLNPFLKEAYIIKVSDYLPAATIVAKDVFFKRAAKFPTFNGMKAGVVIKDKNGKIIEKEGAIVNDDELLIGGWALVYNKEYKSPITIKVSMKEYAKRKKDGTLNKTWAALPATMIRKVAIVQALREAFPDEFSGMYVQEEMDQQNNIAINTKKAEQKDKLKDLLLTNGCENDTTILNEIPSTEIPTVDADGVVVDKEATKSKKPDAKPAEQEYDPDKPQF